VFVPRLDLRGAFAV